MHELMGPYEGRSQPSPSPDFTLQARNVWRDADPRGRK